MKSKRKRRLSSSGEDADSLNSSAVSTVSSKSTVEPIEEEAFKFLHNNIDDWFVVEFQWNQCFNKRQSILADCKTLHEFFIQIPALYDGKGFNLVSMWINRTFPVIVHIYWPIGMTISHLKVNLNDL